MRQPSLQDYLSKVLGQVARGAGHIYVFLQMALMHWYLDDLLAFV